MPTLSGGGLLGLSSPRPRDLLAGRDRDTAMDADGPRRFLPGFEALHRMTGILLAEYAPADARVLMLGTGGGLELRALAEAYPGWTFVGVDPPGRCSTRPSVCSTSLQGRVTLVEGYSDDAPDSPFDPATCLLTLRFLGPVAREDAVRVIHRRLKPGAPFGAARSSVPQDGSRSPWIARYETFAIASGASRDQVAKARSAMPAHLYTLAPGRMPPCGGRAASRRQNSASPLSWRGWIGRAQGRTGDHTTAAGARHPVPLPLVAPENPSVTSLPAWLVQEQLARNALPGTPPERAPPVDQVSRCRWSRRGQVSGPSPGETLSLLRLPLERRPRDLAAEVLASSGAGPRHRS